MYVAYLFIHVYFVCNNMYLLMVFLDVFCVGLQYVCVCCLFMNTHMLITYIYIAQIFTCLC